MTLSELIWEKLKEAVRYRRCRRCDRAFFTRAPWTGPGPSDVARRHDEYLHGKDSEFG